MRLFYAQRESVLKFSIHGRSMAKGRSLNGFGFVAGDQASFAILSQLD